MALGVPILKHFRVGCKYILILMYVTITNKLPYLRPLERPESSEGLKALVCGSSGPGFESSWRLKAFQSYTGFHCTPLSFSPHHRLDMTEILL